MEEEKSMSVGSIVLNIIAQVLLMSIAVYITYKSFENGMNWFSWHPSLMTISVTIT